MCIRDSLHRLARNRHMVRDILYLFHHLLGKCLRQPIGPYNGQDIRARVIDMTDDLRNTSLRLMLLTAKIRNLHNHQMCIRDSSMSL